MGQAPALGISEEETIGTALVPGTVHLSEPLWLAKAPLPGILPCTCEPSISVPEAGPTQSHSSSEHLTGKQDLESGRRTWLGHNRRVVSMKRCWIQSGRKERAHGFIISSEGIPLLGPGSLRIRANNQTYLSHHSQGKKGPQVPQGSILCCFTVPSSQQSVPQRPDL